MRRLVLAEGVALVLVPPGDQRLEHRLQIAALSGELIPNLSPAGLLLPLDDSGALELAEADRQPLRRHIREQSPQVAETPRPREQIPDDQQRPAVANRVERSCSKAEVAVARLHHLTRS